MAPKTDADEQQLWLAIRRLEPLRPTFVSVTYGAGGTTRDRTVRVTGRIAAETTLTPVGHLTAVSHSVAELRHVVGSYAAVGVRNVLALRGDPPGDPGPTGSRIRTGSGTRRNWSGWSGRPGDFCVGVAAFPEGHSRASAGESDIAFFIDKCAAGRRLRDHPDVLLPDDYLRFRDRVAARGCACRSSPGSCRSPACR